MNGHSCQGSTPEYRAYCYGGSVRFAQVEDQLHCVSGRIRQPSF